MKTKILYRQSTFPCGVDRVYSLLKNLSTLKYIAAPYATFEAQNKSDDIEWG